jgi:predicted RNase H-like HicB family nuclease
MALTLREQAESLADRPYLTVVLKQNDPPILWAWTAYNPDLDGCISDGQTPDEAIACLREARIDIIEHLLMHGIPVPRPQTFEDGWRISIDADLLGWLAPKYDEAKQHGTD